MSSSHLEKKISCPAELDKFKTSSTFLEILEFTRLCGDSIIGFSPPESTCTASITVQKIEAFMNRLYDLVNEIPPLDQPMRFGNKAFRLWFDRLEQEIPQFLADLLGSQYESSQKDIAQYLQMSFGNETRIDYGTGHELNIALFFLCLYKLKLVLATDLNSLIMRGFRAYIRTMRKLQEDYMLEPAGSHGVWGLDDYHCLLFVWGAAQLCGHPTLRPSSIHDHEVMQDDALTADFMYLDAIRFIKRIKRGAPFAESSPMLHDISGLADWSQVYKGLFRLFQGEVLLKFPVAQHILFGTLIPCTWRGGEKAPERGSEGGGGEGGCEAVSPHTTVRAVPMDPLGVMTAAPWATSGNSRGELR